MPAARRRTSSMGGGASPERIATALKLVLSNPKVRAVLVNIFAGINRCDWVAKGVVQACETVRREGVAHGPTRRNQCRGGT
jgi:succinyl-CoA synthetase beta subunit